jgi:hypothetical protein
MHATIDLKKELHLYKLKLRNIVCQCDWTICYKMFAFCRVRFSRCGSQSKNMRRVARAALRRNAPE